MTSAKPAATCRGHRHSQLSCDSGGGSGIVGLSGQKGAFSKMGRDWAAGSARCHSESHAEAYVKLRMKLVGETVARTYTPAQVAAQVGEVADAAEALVRALWRVGGEAADALNVSNAPWYDPFGATAPTIFDCQNMASYLAKKAKSAAPNGETAKRRGPARSRTTHKIALLAACDFFAITGKKPTRSKNKNQFSEFLFELFKALMIDAQASAFSQTAVEKWRALTPDQRSNVMTGHFPSETAVKN